MKLVSDQDPKAFLSNITPVLEREADIHSFALSLAERWLAQGRSLHLMVRAVGERDETIAVGLQTDPERPFIVSKLAASEARGFANLVADRIEKLSAVNGPAPGVDAFAETWAERKGCGTALQLNMRLHVLKQVTEPRSTSGFGRLARADDQSLMFRWLRAFHNEAVPHDPLMPDDALVRDIEDAVSKQQYYLWEDSGRVVALVGSRRETKRERWIAPVYTPPELRGKGYGTALTAHVSRAIVAAGKGAMLFTDLANPTSNSIYRQVGYVPLADFKQIMFVSK